MPKSNSGNSTKLNRHQVPTASCGTPRAAVAKTQYGKARGYVEEGVLTFKGK